MLVIEDEAAVYRQIPGNTVLALPECATRNGAGWHIDHLLPARHACQVSLPQRYV